MPIKEGMNYPPLLFSYPPPNLAIPGQYDALDVHHTGISVICRKLSLLFHGPETLQLCNFVKAWSREAVGERVEHERRGIAASFPSEQLSRFDYYLSQFFTTPGSQIAHPQAQPFDGYQDSGQPGGGEPNSLNYALPSPTDPPTSATKPICIACDKAYQKLGALKKHQAHGCEQQLEWVCQSCPSQVFDDKTKLEQHHYSSHADTCSGCLNPPNGRRSETCQEQLSRCSRKLPAKRAWGCPCCIQCFDTLSAWNLHSRGHPIHNRKVQNWSFSTMIRSLFQHGDLVTFYHKYNLDSLDWAYLEEKDERTLRFALERHVRPPRLLDHNLYSYLTMFEALAKYARTLGTARGTDGKPATWTPDATAMAPALPYDHALVDQALEHPPLMPTSLAHGSVGTNANLWHGQHHQHHLQSSTYVEVETDEELDPKYLGYLSASGVGATLQLNQDNSLKRIKHCPVKHDTHVPNTDRQVDKTRAKSQVQVRGGARTLAAGDSRTSPQCRNSGQLEGFEAGT